MHLKAILNLQETPRKYVEVFEAARKEAAANGGKQQSGAVGSEGGFNVDTEGAKQRVSQGVQQAKRQGAEGAQEAGKQAQQGIDAAHKQSKQGVDTAVGTAATQARSLSSHVVIDRQGLQLAHYSNMARNV